MADELLLKLPDYKHTCQRYTTGDVDSKCLACAYESGAEAQLAKAKPIIEKQERERMALGLGARPWKSIKNSSDVWIRFTLNDIQTLKEGK
ncbi:unnamed protein product [marine sediment metagenome]|uniref:Uncharacterized protein n=1 Tax=marine sediment metagenome TaxID=412755 RepID=X1BQB5_9ZZZZ